MSVVATAALRAALPPAALTAVLCVMCCGGGGGCVLKYIELIGPGTHSGLSRSSVAFQSSSEVVRRRRCERADELKIHFWLYSSSIEEEGRSLLLTCF